MKLLDRYVAREVILSTLLALTVLVGMSAFFELVGELDDIGKHDYGALQAIQYALLSIPTYTYELLPTAALLGTLLGLGGLAANSELIVMRASGVSVWRIVWAVTQVGGVLIALGFFVGEVVAPLTKHYAESERAIAKSEHVSLKGRDGIWARDGLNYINIRRVLPEGRLEGISIYEFDEAHRLRTATYAEGASYLQERWLLEGVRQSLIHEDGVEVRSRDQVEWGSLINPDLLDVVAVRPEDLPTWNLRKYINYLRDNGLSSERYELALWIKVISPLSSVVMLLLALPFVFGPLRSVGAGQRVLVGILVGVGVYLLNKTVSRMGQVYDFNPFLSAALPTLLFLGIALLALRRVR
jgi:lipopolysaccharide export system permease protein